VVDLDLSIEALPAGTQLSIGEAIVEVTAPPHTGCAQFSDRFGIDALAWVSTPVGKAYRMRGMHVRVIQGGAIRTGDVIRRS
jgi:MOSC domain-containing protein YiiM